MWLKIVIIAVQSLLKKTWSQRFCCYKCRRTDKYKKRNSEPGSVYNKKFPKIPCEYCGQKDLRAIHRHHIDNIPGRDNLMFLCANCHQIFHIEHRRNPVEIHTKEDIVSFLKIADVVGRDRANDIKPSGLWE